MNNDPDVALCLEHFSEFNASNTRYARIEIITQPFKAVRLMVGPDGFGCKEIPYYTRHYHLTKSGDVVYYDSYHL